MSGPQISIRIGVTGKEEVKRSFEEVGKAGEASMAGVSTAMDSAGAATDREVARLKRLADAARMAGEADTSQKRYNTVLGVSRPEPKSARDSASVFEEAAREAESFQARANALRAQIDPLGAAQARLNAELADYAALAKRGAITTTEHASAEALAKERFAATEKALKGVGGASGLTRMQLMTLQYTFNDVIASMSTGMSPMTILMQQGGQVTQAFGGLRGTIGALGSAMGVVGGIVAGVALAFVGLTAAAFANDASVRAVATALSGAGRASGATAAQLEAVAQSSADLGRLSVTAARDMEVAFLATGKVGASEMGKAIAVARDFAVTLGLDAKAGADQLAKALADPARGADELNARLSFLDDRTRQYIRTLVDQNDRTGAQKVLLDALVPALANAEQATNALGRAWDYVSRQASNAWDAMGKAVNRAVDGRNSSEELDLLKWQRARLRENATASGVTPLMLPQVEKRIAELEGKLAEDDARAQKLAADAKTNLLSIEAGDIARTLTPGFEDLKKLQIEQAKLKAVLDDPAARTKVADLAQVQTAYDGVTRAVTSYLAPAEKARRLDELDIAALRAKSPAEKAAIAETRKRIELSGAVVTSGQAEVEILRAGVKARAEATQVIAEQSLALTTNTNAALGVAEGWLKGAEAASVMEARRKALTESIRDGVDVETRAARILQESIAEEALTAAKSANDLTTQADAQKRLNDQVAAGAISSEQARNRLQVEQALRPLLTAEALAEGEAKATLTRVIEALSGAYAHLQSEQTRAAALQTLEGQKSQVALLQKQIDLMGTSESTRSALIAQLQAEQQMRERGIDLTSTEAQAILQNAGAIARLGQSLSLAQSSTQELAGLTDSIFGHFSELITSGKLDWQSFADAGRAALADLETEMLKLALLNPLKNVLFGTSLPTTSSVGGILGSLMQAFKFHEGGMVGAGGAAMTVPIAMFAAAPRLHGGGFLTPDEVPAILQKGERVLNRDEARRYGQSNNGAVVNVTIQTQNPAAFQASRTQVAADLARAVRLGMRGL